MINTDFISLIAATAALTASAATDLNRRKVLNAVTFPAILIGLLLTFIGNKAELPSKCLWLILWFLFGATRMMGMGDLKLVMALTALRGIEEASFTLLFGAVFLFAYCLLTEPKKTKTVVKDTVGFLTVGGAIRKVSDKEYPFAAFLALGYPAAWILTNICGR